MINDIGQRPEYEFESIKELKKQQKEDERKAAFWQVYSAMIGNEEMCAGFDVLAEEALKAVNAGLKALEGNSDASL